MGMKLNDINGEASKYAFGLKATSSSLKPVHLAQTIFNQTLEYEYSQDLLFEFLERPSKTPSGELSDEVFERIEFSHQRDLESLNKLRQRMRKVLANDNAFYASQRGSAPTCTSDWFIISPMVGVTAGRFLHTLLEQAEGDIEQKLADQLRDHHDSVSLLFRPLAKDAERSDATIKPWSQPELGDAFEQGGIAASLITGFSDISRHLRSRNGPAINYPRDLRRIVKFASFGFYTYLANRHNEIRTDGRERKTFLPILLNYTGETDNPVADASLACVDTVATEVRAASRLGVREALNRRGYKSYSESEILEMIDNRELLDVNRQNDEKLIEDFETFRDMFTADPAEDMFDNLVNSVTDAIHLSRYDTYTPVSTTQTFGWRCGLLKPRGNRANERRFRLDPAILKTIILSLLEPEGRLPLQEFCTELRQQYGLIVGGTPNDRSHLQEWDISIGASTYENDPLSHKNYEAFKDTIVDLGYAQEFADGVTIVSPSIDS